MRLFFPLDSITNYSGEIWKPIEGFDKYYISNYGRVKSYKRHYAKLLKVEITTRGYCRVDLNNNGQRFHKLVHRLVAKAFIENNDPSVKTTVDHIDGNKKNNRADNLQWLSLSDNVKAYYNRENKNE